MKGYCVYLPALQEDQLSQNPLVQGHPAEKRKCEFNTDFTSWIMAAFKLELNNGYQFESYIILLGCKKKRRSMYKKYRRATMALKINEDCKNREVYLVSGKTMSYKLTIILTFSVHEWNVKYLKCKWQNQSNTL